MAGWIGSLDEFANAGHEITDQTIVVLPLGATEQHGPHLPLETDTTIARGVCDRLIDALGPDKDIRFLPTEPIGYSVEHMDHGGTKTLTYDQALIQWISIGETAAKAGVRRLVLLNAHGGNSPLMTIVCQELRVRFDMLAVATSWTRFIKESGVVSAQEEAFGIHGGDIETSMMLALDPDSVDMEKAQDFRSLQQELADKFKHLRAYGPHAFGWKAADLNRQGVTGNAGAATKEKGEKLLDIAVGGLQVLFEEIRDFTSFSKSAARGQAKILETAGRPGFDLLFWVPKLLNAVILVLAWVFSSQFSDNLVNSYGVVITATIAAFVSTIRLAIGRENPRWTIISVLSQAVMLVGIFAAVYYGFGLADGIDPTPPDAVYFSLVTWTTLGYGDLKPADGLRLLAATEALIGYAFLGSLVGVFANILIKDKQ